MSDIITRNKMLEASKERFRVHHSKGEIEMANSIIRDASFNCNKLGKNVVVEFYHLVCDTASDVRELKELVQNNIIKCSDCDFVALNIHSLNSHRGKKHKDK